MRGRGVGYEVEGLQAVEATGFSVVGGAGEAGVDGLAIVSLRATDNGCEKRVA